VVDVDAVSSYPHDEQMADEARGNGIGVAQDLNGAEGADTNLELTTGLERSGRQGAEDGALLGDAGLAGEVAVADEVLEEAHIGGTVGKVARAAQAEGLVNCLLEAVVGLLDIAVLVG